MKNNKRKLFFFVLTIIILTSGVVKNNPSAKITRLNLTADSLKFIGHSSMKIKTKDGKVIYIDPYQPGDYSDSADIILVTHGHSDHNQTNLVAKKTTCTIITNVQANIGGVYQTFNVDGIKIYSVAAYNSFHNINSCVGYVLEFNGIKLYHAGDTGNIPEMASLADSNITYAFFPIDSIYTMSPAVATLAAGVVQADYNIPIHTEPPPDNYNEDKVSRFVPENRLLVRHGETIALINPNTGLDNISSPPICYKLFQNYPNPFNPNTKISYSIPTFSFVTLKIFDLNGREIETLVEKQVSAGNYTIEWNAHNITSGVYFYRLQAGTFSDTKKFILMK